MKLNKRIGIVPTTRCNQRCKFCFHGRSFRKKDISLNRMKIKLRLARMMGVHSVDFFGGEVTLYPHLERLISYSKKIGYKDIGLISNGLRLDDHRYFKNLIEAGMSNLVLTILGSDRFSHDSMTKCSGSFDRLLKVRDIANDLRFPFRVNTVIYDDQIQDMKKIRKTVMSDFKPFVFNVLAYMYCTDNNHSEISNKVKRRKQSPLKYEDIANILKDTFDENRESEINFRHIPFCYMEGYEEYLVNMKQIHYDRYEWDYVVMDLLNNGLIKGVFNQLRGFVIHFLKSERKKSDKTKIERTKSGKGKSGFIKSNSHSQKNIFHRGIINVIEKQSFIKLPQCSDCKFEFICSGVYKGYISDHGTDGVVPIKGKKVMDPLHYIKKRKAK